MMDTSKTFLSLALMLLVMGCATTEPVETHTRFLYKTGTTIYQKQADHDACKVESFAKIPQAIGHQTVGGSYNPGSVSCSTNNSGRTSCYTYGASYEAPEIKNYDMNASLRSRYIDQCMNRKGYKSYNMPYCTQPGGYSNVTPAPPISQISCLDRSRTYTID